MGCLLFCKRWILCHRSRNNKRVYLGRKNDSCSSMPVTHACRTYGQVYLLLGTTTMCRRNVQHSNGTHLWERVIQNRIITSIMRKTRRKCQSRWWGRQRHGLRSTKIGTNWNKCSRCLFHVLIFCYAFWCPCLSRELQVIILSHEGMPRWEIIAHGREELRGREQ